MNVAFLSDVHGYAGDDAVVCCLNAEGETVQLLSDNSDVSMQQGGLLHVSNATPEPK
jgi:hypothetical protein